MCFLAEVLDHVPPAAAEAADKLGAEGGLWRAERLWSPDPPLPPPPMAPAAFWVSAAADSEQRKETKIARGERRRLSLDFFCHCSRDEEEEERGRGGVRKKRGEEEE